MIPAVKSYSRQAQGTHAYGGNKKGKDSPYLITTHRVLELIPVLGSQPAGDVSHKPDGRLPLQARSYPLNP